MWRDLKIEKFTQVFGKKVFKYKAIEIGNLEVVELIEEPDYAGLQSNQIHSARSSGRMEMRDKDRKEN